MASTSSSSGSWPNALRKYDVFISFRGEDTRYNFTSHLHAALNRASLEVFRDDTKLEKGHEITPSLTQAIKDSNISVIVFSEDFASSKWCLDELDQIMQYRKDEGQIVIPIFYKVEPSDVRNQTGAYKKAFEDHEIDYQHDPDRVNRWRAALSEAGKLSGTHCQTSTDESKLIQEIVTDVSAKLECVYDCQGTLKDVIGIDEMIEPIEKLLEKSHKVGIWGMGGVGKTTMAKAVFAKLSCRFDSCCFLENVREKTEKNGSEHVRNSLISKLLGQDMHNNPSNASSNSAYVARRFGSKRVLVVFDDVDSFNLLEDLQENICNFLGEGSKVIITTRDKRLLRANDYEIHEAKGLSYENSHRLFVSKAFRSDHREDGFEQLIKGFVCYTQQNPLALKVLGSLVRSVHKKVWDDLLRKLKAGNPNEEIQKVLKLSYDGLDHKEQQIFLDIACFLKGEIEEFVEELLDSYDFYPTIGMQTLKDKALIVTISGRVEMHDLIQEMGRQIVREESILEPGKRSRLWDSREISNILRKYEGEKEVESIILDRDESRGALELTAKTFNKMTRLRFLKVYFRLFWIDDVDSIPTSLESISTQMRYFHWDRYPMKSLPSNFCAKHLLELKLTCGKVETLWEGVQDLANLRRLNLRFCKNLRELPDFSKACRLERVDLSGCDSLGYVHASFLSLHSLISLDVSHCISLESLQSRIHLKSLKQFEILKEYPMKSLPSNFCAKHLLELNLRSGKVETLWEGVQDLANLRTLDLGWCKNLRELPDFSKACRLESVYLNGCESLCYVHPSLLSLHSLIDLGVSYCFSLESLQSRIHLKSLKEINMDRSYNLKEFSMSSEELTSLNLSGTMIEELSPSIGLCSKLTTLYLLDTRLKNLPIRVLSCLTFLEKLRISPLKIDNVDLCVLFDRLRSLQSLVLMECCNLTELPDNITQLLSLEELHLVGCPDLTKLPVTMRHLSKLQHLSVRGCTALHSLPELPPSLRILDATDCTSLETVSPSTISSTPQNYGQKFLLFNNCVKLDLGAIDEQVKFLLEKAVHEKEVVQVYYPVKKVPEWFGNNRTQNDSDTLKLCLSSHTLVGLVFCAVAPDFPEKELCRYLPFAFRVAEVVQFCEFPELVDFRSGNVLLCSNPVASESILEKIEGNRGNHKATTYSPTLSFKFSCTEEYGVYPIYASEIRS